MTKLHPKHMTSNLSRYVTLYCALNAKETLTLTINKTYFLRSLMFVMLFVIFKHIGRTFLVDFAGFSIQPALGA